MGLRAQSVGVLLLLLETLHSSGATAMVMVTVIVIKIKIK
jgi:hypothetical protein